MSIPHATADGPSFSLLGNLNAVKREIAFVAASGVLMALGGGRLFTLANLVFGSQHSTTSGEPRGHHA